MKPQIPSFAAGIGLILFPLMLLFLQNRCTLMGFAIGASIDARQPKQEKNIQGWEVTTLKDNARITVYRKNGESLDGIYRGVVKIDSRKDSVPTGLILERKGGSSVQHHIPFDKIDHIYVPARKAKGRIIGSAIGLLVDAGLFLVVGSFIAIDIGSAFLCPHVYSYDGKGAYHLDAEMCTGVFFESAQYADYARLDHLEPAPDNRYRIKLANEMQESDYIDQFNLLVFDCPAGDEVYADAEGRFYGLSNPVSPRKAFTPEGADLTRTLADDTEGSCWLSNPFVYVAGPKTSLKEYAYLEFDRPAGANKAVLLLKLRNTPWAAAQYAEFLSLRGEHSEEWLAGLDCDSSARHELLDVFKRENGLEISIWNGTQWQSAMPVTAISHVVESSVIRELDLGGIPGETLNIRLASPRGFWMVNIAMVDFTYTSDLVPVKLQAAHMIAGNATDAIDRIRDCNGKRLSLANAGDFVELDFDCPPQDPGAKRTILAGCSGYYKPKIRASGDGQAGLMDSLMREPGALSQWRLQRLNDQVRLAAH